jgi:acetyltransferase-like isoleucine patch superfamily enzyme
MNFERLLLNFAYQTKFHGYSRAKFTKKHNIFLKQGDNVSLPKMILPLYPKLVSFGNNIIVASGVRFVTHDAIHIMLNRMPLEIMEKLTKKGSFFEKKSRIVNFKENKGLIEIADNVFIGSDTTILPNVRIGSNVVIGACSLINKDLESNGVYAGIPAKRIGDIGDLIIKRFEN